ncbi:MAG: hypothetical protein AAGH71_07590 [Planctomycetota bacterium]
MHLLRAAAFAVWMGTQAAAAQTVEDTRRAALEERRELLASRLAEIDAELAGDVPPGTVRLFGRGGLDAMRPSPTQLGDRGGEAARGGPRDRGGFVDAETRSEMLAALETTDPELAALIRDALQKRDGGGLPVFGRLREMNDLRGRDPEAFAARRQEIRAGLQILKVAGSLRDAIAEQADTAVVDQIIAELRAAISNGFDAKRDVLRVEIERVEERAEGMRRRFDQAESKRSSLIEEHTERVLDRIRKSARRDKGGE